MADTLESKDLLDLAKLVSEMRHEQKEFARTGRFNRRESAKRMEAQVDKATQEILSDHAQLWN